MATRALWIAAVVTLTACTSPQSVDELSEDLIATDVRDTEAQDNDVPVPSLDCGTFLDNTCGDGLYCAGEPVCGAVWSCQQEHPCSAAGPFIVCGCDGRVTWAAAGCTERHAWAFRDLPDTGIEQGDACDGTARDPLTFDLIARVDGFPDGVTTATLWWGADADLDPVEVVLTREGTLEARLDGVTRDGLRWLGATVFADVDGDGLCTTGTDLAGSITPTRFDPLALDLFLETPVADWVELPCHDAVP